MSITLLVTVLVLYLTLLFWVASFGDKHQFVKNSWTKHPWVYALSIGVYCTSWTFYGLVGTAATKGWGFLPILLGPFLLFIFGQPLLKRIAALCKQENIRSIADFFAARYGKRRGIATSVTLIVLVSTIPYIALQIKAVTDSMLLVSAGSAYSPEEMGLFTAAAMISFALVFGVKRLDASGYHAGLMSAVAFESLVKLLALIAVAIFSYLLINNVNALGFSSSTEVFSRFEFDLRFGVETLISAAAILCLPRMFHVTFVENLSEKHLRTARVVFPAYLGVVALCVICAAIAGNTFFQGQGVSSDAYLLELPLTQGNRFLTIVVLIGGFSAATAMIIVASVTLSHMLSNDVILPILINRHLRQQTPAPDYSRSLIFARRVTVILVVALAYIYQRLLAGNAALTDIGLIAFGLAVQLCPALLFGLYTLRGHASAAYAGLAAGCSIWFFTLMLPLLAQAGAISSAVIENGVVGISWLRPENLFNFTYADAYTRGVTLSLLANIFAYWFMIQVAKPRLSDRIQARAFLNLSRAEPSAHHHKEYQLTDIRALLRQFLGESITEQIISRHDKNSNSESVKPELLDAAEHALSGVVGVASARAMFATLTTGDQLGVEDVVNIFEETTKALRFNQDMIVASFESISSAISVVNDDLNLVSWNRRYEEMFDYPDGMLKVGVPIADLVRFNSQRGMLGSGSVEEHVQKRLNHLKVGKPYRVVRNHGDCVIEIKGNPLPDGGYVTTYDDISEFISAQDQLEKTNLYLEKRVKERTLELEAAQKEAENANRSKSRFLALASHDILQPLNAANLYANILLESSRKSGHKDADTVEHLQQAIESSESIISTLLEISKLDTGALSTDICETPLHHILSSLVHEFRVQLTSSIELRYVDTRLVVRTDPRYLRRILQNFLSNAVKYTQRGKILVGCRRRGANVEVFIIDTGPGVHPDEQQKIFEDFYRSSSQQNIQGLGLGLAVATRFSNLLGHDIQSASRLGLGSSFSVTVPVVVPVDTNGESGHQYEKRVDSFSSSALSGCKVFYLDDDGQNIHAMDTLLRGWDCLPTTADTVQEALFIANSEIENTPDLLIVDWQLDNENDGISAAKKMHEIWQREVPTCVVSASQEPELSKLVASHGFEFLRKPIKPGKLRAILEQMLKRSSV